MKTCESCGCEIKKGYYHVENDREGYICKDCNWFWTHEIEDNFYEYKTKLEARSKKMRDKKIYEKNNQMRIL